MRWTAPAQWRPATGGTTATIWASGRIETQEERASLAVRFRTGLGHRSCVMASVRGSSVAIAVIEAGWTRTALRTALSCEAAAIEQAPVLGIVAINRVSRSQRVSVGQRQSACIDAHPATSAGLLHESRVGDASIFMRRLSWRVPSAPSFQSALSRAKPRCTQQRSCGIAAKTSSREHLTAANARNAPTCQQRRGPPS